MSESHSVRAVIVDFGMGNLFSVRHACQAVGLPAHISADQRDVGRADAIILPGVGAYGDAMATLRRLDLVAPIRAAAAAGIPIVGICLGLQLLMTESEEFGHHQGLDLVKGPVVRLPSDGARPKVPQVGWNRVNRVLKPEHADGRDLWASTPLDGFADGEYFYFVHSFHAIPDQASHQLSATSYGGRPFCSSVICGNVFGSQFHPERSGPAGLRMYRNIAVWCQSFAQIEK